MITSLAATDVSKITSGQVIVDVVSVVKELLDNAIDAGSTKIDIVFNNYGATSIEVSDNGSGVAPDDYAVLCQKHHTSKLSDFAELATVSTLGFRGEAMSSMCAVANVKVVTCSSETFPRAASLTYAADGTLAQKSFSVSGKKGTTVSVTDLFHAMPVRRKNLLKHIKREYSKALSLLMSYLLTYTGVRFAVFNISAATNKKSMVLATEGGSASISAALVNVFGSNGAYGLVPLELKVKDIEALFKLNMSSVPVALTIELKGLISDYSFGMGRGSTDRQFLSINSRPVTHKRITKLINEVYRSFNATQCPVFVLDLQLDTSLVDVNVTPDKRSVMMQCEDVICEVIREELTAFYDQRNNFVPKSQLGVVHMGSQTTKDVVRSRPESKNSRISEDEEMEEEVSKLEDEMEVEDAEEEVEIEEVTYDVSSVQAQSPIERQHESQDESEIEVQEESHEAHEPSEPEEQDEELPSQEVTTPESEDENAAEQPNEEADMEGDTETEELNVLDTFEDIDSDHLESFTAVETNSPGPTEEVASESQQVSSERLEVNPAEDTLFVASEDEENEEDHRTQVSHDHRGTCCHEENKVHVAPSKRRDSRAESTVYKRRAVLQVRPGKLSTFEGLEESGHLASLQDITMAMEIRKQDFTEMSVAGQFNFGFIVVSHRNRLFIVDQHASDEIYNYERLMKSLTLRAQPLVVGRTLELSPIDEMVILDHQLQLKKNGFIVEEIPDANPGRRVKLTGVPVSKNVVFDDSDLHELVHKLHDYGVRDADVTRVHNNTDQSQASRSQAAMRSQASVRCTKVDKMIASRACRSSIMIGSALTKQTMQTVVRHLSGLDRPWNCPHGRPTMRHLADLEGGGFTQDYEI